MSRSHDLRLALSLGLLAGLPHMAQAALSFNAGLSTIVYEHDVVEGGTINRVKLQPLPAIQTASAVTFVLPDLTLSGSADGVPTLKSRAKVGLGHNTTSLTGSGVFKSGSLLTQADPGNLSEEFSTLTIGFDLHWTVTAPSFGPPIIGSFSVPLLAVVGDGGTATAEIIDLHWEQFNGVTTDLRAPASTLITFDPGSTLTTLTIPGAAFNPAGLTPGDDFIVRGTVKLAVKNANDPVSITICPDYQETVLDDGASVHYRFDDGAIGTSPASALDSAPLGGDSNGVYSGTAVLVQGVRGSALRANGLDQRVQSVLPSSQSFTAELWASSDQPVWNASGWLADAGDANGFVISPIAGTSQWQGIVFDNAGNPHVIGTFDAGPFDITQLHHYAVMFDDASNIARMYFDGLEVITADLGAILRNGGAPISLSMGFADGAAGLGVIDEFAYYDTALRPEVMLSHFQLSSLKPGNECCGFGAQIVPEPATSGLIGLALMGLLARRRRA